MNVGGKTLMRLHLERDTANMKIKEEVGDAATKLLESASVDPQAEDKSAVAPVTDTDRPPLDMHPQQFEITGNDVATPVSPNQRKPKRPSIDQLRLSHTTKFARTVSDASVPMDLMERLSTEAQVFMEHLDSPTLGIIRFHSKIQPNPKDQPTFANVAEFAACGLAAMCQLADDEGLTAFTRELLRKLQYLCKPAGLEAKKFIRGLIGEAPRSGVEALDLHQGLLEELRLTKVVANRLAATARHPEKKSDWLEFLRQAIDAARAFSATAVPVDEIPAHNQPSFRIGLLHTAAGGFIQGVKTAKSMMKDIYTSFTFNDRRKHLAEFLVLGCVAICRTEASEDRTRRAKEFAGFLKSMIRRRGKGKPKASDRWPAESKQLIQDFIQTRAPNSVVLALDGIECKQLGIGNILTARMSAISRSGNTGDVDWLAFLKSFCTDDAALFLATLPASDRQSAAASPQGRPASNYAPEETPSVIPPSVQQRDPDPSSPIVSFDMPDDEDDGGFGALFASHISHGHGHGTDDLDVPDLLPEEMFEVQIGSQRPANFGSRIQDLLSEDDGPAISAVQSVVPQPTTWQQEKTRQLIPDAPPLDEHPQEAALRRLFTQDKPPGDK